MADGGGSGGLNVLMIIVIVLTLGAAGTAGYYIFRTGDSGAKMTWTGR